MTNDAEPSVVSWTRTQPDERVTEWVRTDGNASVRLRERPDEGFVVRLDRLEQAADGPAYRRETVTDRAAATELAEQLRTANSLDE